MRVCTLIVRLVGLALLLRSAQVVVEMRLITKNVGPTFNAFANAGAPFGNMSNVVQDGWQRIFWYGVAGMVIGAVMAIFAPTVAWLLTYDARESEPPTGIQRVGP